MADYPVLDGNGNTIIAAATGPATSYPVLDGNGDTVLAAATGPETTYPVLSGSGVTLLSQESDPNAKLSDVLDGLGNTLIKGGGDAFAFSEAASYMGQVATRSAVADRVDAASKQVLGRTGHFARDDISSLHLRFHDFYVATTGVETGSGADTTVKAAIEYPEGVFIRVKFGGLETGTYASLSEIVSDAVTLTIPRGERFWIWQFRENASGYLYGEYVYRNSSMGDETQIAASGLTDQTMGGTITSNTTVMCLPPLVLAQTKRISILLLGDSKMGGVDDNENNATGDVGEGARSVGRTFAYVNAGVAGDRATRFSNSNAQRRKFAAYCSHMISNYGINDVRAPRTVQQVKDDLQTVWSRFGLPVYQFTIAPSTIETPSTDGWTSLDGQTVDSTNAVRQAVNTWIRTVPDLLVGVFDIAAIMESGSTGKWVPGLTDDGIHENEAGFLAILSNNVVPPTTFNRPNDESSLSAAQLYINYMTVSPGAAAQALYETATDDLDTAGLWDIIEYLHVYGAHDQQAGRLNLKDPRRFRGYRRNNVLFTPKQGFSSSDGGDLGSGFVPSVDGTLYLLNSASLFAWSLTDARANGTAIAGRNNSGGKSYINPWNSSVNSVGHGLNVATGANAFAPGSAAGLFHVSRTGSGGYDVYRNGVLLGTQSAASGSLPTADIRALSAGDLPTTRTVWCVGAAAGMDSTHAGDLYDILATLKSGLDAL